MALFPSYVYIKDSLYWAITAKESNIPLDIYQDRGKRNRQLKAKGIWKAYKLTIKHI